VPLKLPLAPGFAALCVALTLCLTADQLTNTTSLLAAQEQRYGPAYAVTGRGDVYRFIRDQWHALPRPLSPGGEPLEIHAAPDGRHLYLTTAAQGIVRYDHAAASWRSLATPLMATRTASRRPQPFRKISAFAIDPLDNRRLVCATKHDLYESSDRGESWRPMARQGINPRNYITALAVRGAHVLVGTSSNGIYASTGGAFSSVNSGLPFEPYSSALRFYDEVSSLCIAPSGRRYAGFASGRGLYASARSEAWTKVNLPPDTNRFSRIHSIACRGQVVALARDENIYLVDTKGVATAAQRVPGSTTTGGDAPRACCLSTMGRHPALFSCHCPPHGPARFAGRRPQGHLCQCTRRAKQPCRPYRHHKKMQIQRHRHRHEG
jgi:hypothetical protein